MSTLERKEQFTKAKKTLYTNEGHSEQLGCLDDDEKGRNSIRTLGGTQDLLIVNESGLYSLILRLFAVGVCKALDIDPIATRRLDDDEK